MAESQFVFLYVLFITYFLDSEHSEDRSLILQKL